MRLGINISNELLEKFKPLKNVVNISQICRDAIQIRIESYAEALVQSKNDGMDKTVEKLFLEYSKKTYLDWEFIGREDAKVWVKLVSLEDLEGLFHNIATHKRKGDEPGPFLFPRLLPEAPHFGKHVSEHEEWFQRQIDLEQVDLEVHSNPYIEAEKIYNRGWVSYVTAVWQMVKDRIAADAVTRQKEREKADSKVDVPDNLLNPEK
jgi:hypothetical protein